jgi:hypothetical protein
MVRPDLNSDLVTIEGIKEFLTSLVELLKEGKQGLEGQPPNQISQFCFRFLRSFFEDKE